MINVAITDDHPLIISGIRELLARLEDVRLAGTFASCAETRTGLSGSKPDVLLLDISLPDGDGVALCKELKREYPELKVLALTTYHNLALVKNIMRNGASGYLLKNISFENLKEAIHEVAAGRNFLQPEIREALLNESIGNAPKATGYEIKLTRREKEILQLIVEEHTTQEIADKLYISSKTVETHRTHLIEKLGVRNVAGLVKLAIERGLV